MKRLVIMEQLVEALRVLRAAPREDHANEWVAVMRLVHEYNNA